VSARQIQRRRRSTTASDNLDGKLESCNTRDVALTLISLASVIILSGSADVRKSILVNSSLLNSLGAIRIDLRSLLNSLGAIRIDLLDDLDRVGNFDIRFQFLWPSSAARDIAAVGSSAMGLVHVDSKHRETDESTEPKQTTDDTDSAKSRADGFAVGDGVGGVVVHTVFGPLRQNGACNNNLEAERDKGKDSPDNGQVLGSVERSASNGARDDKSDNSERPYQKGSRKEGEEQTNRRKGNGPDVQALKTGRVGATTAASRLILLLLNHNDAEDELTGE